jgi:Tfp pilus assembly protein PilP
MKNSKAILALWLGTWLGTCAWALPQQVPAAATAKPNAVQMAPPAASVPKTPARTAKAATSSSKASPNSAARADGKPNAQASGVRNVRRRKVVQRTFVKTTAETRAPRAKGRRDPFVSPVVERGGGNLPACSGSGRKCLVIGEITLHGVVHSPEGFIAVVMNGDHTYFLHENDPLADGAVERITKDTITLRERSSDALGRPLTREVTKKLGAPAI